MLFFVSSFPWNAALAGYQHWQLMGHMRPHAAHNKKACSFLLLALNEDLRSPHVSV